MDLYTSLVYARSLPLVGRLAYYALKLLGVEIPRSVKVGQGFELAHGGFGVVVHPDTTIGARVKVYPGVGLGRSDIYRPMQQSRFEGIVIEDDVILSPGAKVLCKEGVLRVGQGTVLGANAVLLQSTGEWEIWAGVPAKLVGQRDRGPSDRNVNKSTNQRILDKNHLDKKHPDYSPGYNSDSADADSLNR